MFAVVGAIALVAVLVTVNVESNKSENITVSTPETHEISK